MKEIILAIKSLLSLNAPKEWIFSKINISSPCTSFIYLVDLPFTRQMYLRWEGSYHMFVLLLELHIGSYDLRYIVFFQLGYAGWQCAWRWLLLLVTTLVVCIASQTCGQGPRQCTCHQNKRLVAIEYYSSAWIWDNMSLLPALTEYRSFIRARQIFDPSLVDRWYKCSQHKLPSSLSDINTCIFISSSHHLWNGSENCSGARMWSHR